MRVAGPHLIPPHLVPPHLVPPPHSTPADSTPPGPAGTNGAGSSRSVVADLTDEHYLDTNDLEALFRAEQSACCR